MRFLLVILLAGCATVQQSSISDREQLLALHEQGLRAHRERDVAMLFANSSDDFVVVSRGGVFTTTRAKSTENMRAYIESTKFSVYRDTIDPIVKISQDGTLGWVICRIEAKGVQTTAKGEEPIEFVSAWISLYEKRGGKWVAIGNVSNFKE